VKEEEERADIHRYECRLQACVKRVEKAEFADQDKLLIKSYLKQVDAQGVIKGVSSRLP
jgi:hypothetical protein